jgi:hypothetical protein
MCMKMSQRNPLFGQLIHANKNKNLVVISYVVTSNVNKKIQSKISYEVIC